MKLDLTPILKNPGAALDFSFNEPLDMLEGGIGTVTYNGPVHFEGSIRNFNGMLELDALASVPYQTQCDRCCDPISDKLSVAIREDVTEESGNAPEPAEAQAEERYTFSGHVLDLDVIAAESLLLQTPAYNLCNQDCKGALPRVRRQPEPDNLRLRVQKNRWIFGWRRSSVFRIRMKPDASCPLH